MKKKNQAMQGQVTLDKALGHFRTITEHKIQVMRHCFAVGLYYQGIMHDMSKYMPSEFLMGCKYYQGGKRSPNNGEREDKGYSFAWMHHKGRNRHHFEFWTDYSQYVKPGRIRWFRSECRENMWWRCWWTGSQLPRFTWRISIPSMNRWSITRGEGALSDASKDSQRAGADAEDPG